MVKISTNIARNIFFKNILIIFEQLNRFRIKKPNSIYNNHYSSVASTHCVYAFFPRENPREIIFCAVCSVFEKPLNYSDVRRSII